MASDHRRPQPQASTAGFRALTAPLFTWEVERFDARRNGKTARLLAACEHHAGEGDIFDPKADRAVLTRRTLIPR
ncbi:hypothetical protein [Sinimarinibacterium sp. CAU 1509]|uniref:hypothetical protein n=1 Tax=Sinimarinibacterium sp. CAU 1509 TaxID=2562283 RepID=UPI001B7FC676|nr:hypothetical protein [Sinimarinibacterium sp. CAU 1509]